MNHSDEHDPDLDPERIESLLLGLPLRDRRPRLDRRVDALLHGRLRQFTPPALSFAAGIVLTIGLLRILPAVRAPHTSPAPALPAMSTPSTPQAAPLRLAVWANPIQTVDEIDGEIHGIPVRLRRIRYQLDIQQSSGGHALFVQFPDSTMLQPIIDY